MSSLLLETLIHILADAAAILLEALAKKLAVKLTQKTPHSMMLIGSQSETESLLNAIHNNPDLIVVSSERIHDGIDSVAPIEPKFANYCRIAQPEVQAKARALMSQTDDTGKSTSRDQPSYESMGKGHGIGLDISGDSKRAGPRGSSPLAPRDIKFFADFYQVSSVKPVVAGPKVVAFLTLGGAADHSDVLTCWKKIGMTKFPKLIDVLVGKSNNNIPGRSDEDSEVTLDATILGAFLQIGNTDDVTVLNLVAPNTDAGFYNAVYAGIYGVTVGGVFYQPSVVSISWGASEANWSSSAMRALNSLHASAAARGVTIVGAAGDNGSTNGMGDGKPHVDFPGSSPDVLCAGGTSVGMDRKTESVWSYNPRNKCSTGGGVSGLWAQPAYQVGVVPTTLSGGKRCVPDISVQGDPEGGFPIYYRGKWTVVGGTSCGAPALAGLIAKMGYIFPKGFNTALYAVYAKSMANKNTSKAVPFHDITAGSNDNLRVKSPTGKYNSTPGYDLCSGIGSPNALVLAAEFAALAITSPDLVRIPGSRTGTTMGTSKTTSTSPVPTTTTTPTPVSVTISLGPKRTVDAPKGAAIPVVNTRSPTMSPFQARSVASSTPPTGSTLNARDVKARDVTVSTGNGTLILFVLVAVYFWANQ